MDCGSYSYVNSSPDTHVLAEDKDLMIYLEEQCDWFGDRCYIAYSLTDTDEFHEFPYTAEGKRAAEDKFRFLCAESKKKEDAVWQARQNS